MEWQNIVFSLLGVVLTALVTWGAERLIALLNSKVKNTKALQYSLDAVAIVNNAVKATYQTYVQGLKDRGTFNADEQKTALLTALKRAESQMSSEVKKYIVTNFGDITEWITQQIESSLYDLKNK